MIILEAEGYMSISIDSDGDLVATCKVGPSQYKKNYVHLNEYVVYVVEDITDTELIKKVYTALMGIQIGEETDKSITDAERNYWFTYADGTEIGFLLIKADKDMMIYGPDGQQLYVITDDNGLFGISIF